MSGSQFQCPKCGRTDYVPEDQLCWQCQKTEEGGESKLQAELAQTRRALELACEFLADMAKVYPLFVPAVFGSDDVDNPNAWRLYFTQQAEQS